MQAARTYSQLKRESGLVCDRRPNSTKRGYGSHWQRRRAAFLHKHPLCMECLKEGEIRAASVVDHIVPHKGNQELFWDESNWQSLCTPHHNRKTVKQDGGFGKMKAEIKGGAG